MLSNREKPNQRTSVHATLKTLKATHLMRRATGRTPPTITGLEQARKWYKAQLADLGPYLASVKARGVLHYEEDIDGNPYEEQGVPETTQEFLTALDWILWVQDQRFAQKRARPGQPTTARTPAGFPKDPEATTRAEAYSATAYLEGRSEQGWYTSEAWNLVEGHRGPGDRLAMVEVHGTCGTATVTVDGTVVAVALPDAAFRPFVKPTGRRAALAEAGSGLRTLRSLASKGGKARKALEGAQVVVVVAQGFYVDPEGGYVKAAGQPYVAVQAERKWKASLYHGRHPLRLVASIQDHLAGRDPRPVWQRLDLHPSNIPLVEAQAYIKNAMAKRRGITPLFTPNNASRAGFTDPWFTASDVSDMEACLETALDGNHPQDGVAWDALQHAVHEVLGPTWTLDIDPLVIQA